MAQAREVVVDLNTLLQIYSLLASDSRVDVTPVLKRIAEAVGIKPSELVV